MVISTAGKDDRHTRHLQEVYLAGIHAQLEAETPEDQAVIAKLLRGIEKGVRATLLDGSNATTP